MPSWIPGDAPFSAGSAAQPSSYAIELCGLIGEQLKLQLALPGLRLHYRQQSVVDMLDAVAQGRGDTVCGAEGDTLKRREQVSFSLPFFAADLGLQSELREVSSNAEGLAQVAEGKDPTLPAPE